MARGQISIFILLGLLVLFFIVFFIFYQTQQSEALPAQHVSSSPLETYIEECASTVAKNAVTLASLQGGYIDVPSPSFAIGLYVVPYYYVRENNVLQNVHPSIDLVQQEISRYIDQELIHCVGNFTSFIEQGYTLYVENPQTITELTESQAFVTIDYPLSIEFEGEKTQLSQFHLTVPTKILVYHRVAELILLAHTDDTNIPLTLLNLIASNTNVSISMGHFNSTVLYSLHDAAPEEQVGQEIPELYNFAIYYYWDEENE